MVYDAAIKRGVRMSFPDYKVIETEIGPMISESRTSIYDVLLSQKEGNDFFALCIIHNLKPVQVQVALAYIEAHLEQLEAELPMILQKKAERQAYYENIAAEIQRKIDQLPMTPERQAFYALREKNQHQWGENGNAGYLKR